MAVYEIARIQLRRGRVNTGAGVPQLASGELAWAIDSQELYIGNGAVAEGAPLVGNTRVLTEKDLNQLGFFGSDSIVIETVPWQTATLYAKGAIVSNDIEENGLVYNYSFICTQEHTSDDFVTDLNSGYWTQTPYLHTYQKDYVDTGPSAATPVIRSIKARLSDRVSLADFITTADELSNDATSALSRAINNLFDNLEGTANAVSNTQYRVVLEIPAGTYNISSTVFIPSYSSIVGAGIDKTIINYTGIGPVFAFRPDEVEPTYNTQPRNILLQGISIVTSEAEQEAIRLDVVRHSEFKDIKITGNWGLSYSSTNSAVLLNAIATDLTCEYNLFENIQIEQFSNGIFSFHDIRYNNFFNCSVLNSGAGFVFGVGTDLLSPGQETGPKNNLIDKCIFHGIFKHAVHIDTGTENTVSNCILINVGNDSIGSLETTPRYPQIYFADYTNVAQNIQSQRCKWLSSSATQEPFIPKVSGSSVSFDMFGSHVFELVGSPDPVLLFRLPLRTNESGTPEKIGRYIVSYTYDSDSIDGYTRNGELDIAADFSNVSTAARLTDTFEYSGISELMATNLRFSVEFIDHLGEIFDGSGVLSGLGVFYINLNELDQGMFAYTYSTKY